MSDDAAVLSQQARESRQAGDWAQAVVLYDRALAVDDTRLNDWINKGLSLWNLKRNEEALTCYDRAIELDPNAALAWMNRGNVLHDLSRPRTEAIACYDRALAIDPQLATAWYNKGDELAWMGDFNGAILCFEKARDLGIPEAASMINKCREIVMRDLSEIL